ncbi:Ger(x)C family spore germination protein [Paenibacillus qinlingensis]|uniref:Ger(X)C family germination protein n=1 Tax=Paenibacillus qinlingensis TaxID=1837343 RepID=A0ABU1NTG3_9BACL|nr:Ger(x)C family spore germination protein [Paenibacillus qinlingensis]MDR6550624.1 Ger(x)C family germination protein [Paenibacillus qinlingensis]
MRKIAGSLLLLVILCGCWDQTSIQDLQMIDVIGLDKAEQSDNKKMSIAISSLHEAHQGGGKPSMQLMTGEGKSVSTAIEHLDSKIAGGITFNQSRLYIFSKSFAKEKPDEELKVLGRIPNSPLNASVAVFDGDVSELLAKQRIAGKTVANFLVVLLKEAQKLNYSPTVTLFRFILEKQDPYVDAILPLLKMQDDDVQLDGSALFRDGSYSGIDLSATQTKLALLLKESKGTSVFFITEINNQTYQIWIKKAKRKLVVKTNDNKISEIILPLEMQVFLTDSGKSNKALSETKLDSIEKMLTEEINKQATQTIQLLQKANCDYLGLGRDIHGYHYKEWSQMNWRDVYPNLKIRPEVEVRILNSGVML